MRVLFCWNCAWRSDHPIEMSWHKINTMVVILEISSDTTLEHDCYRIDVTLELV